MKPCQLLLILFALSSPGHSFILFPDDLASLLNIFYSRIPRIRFGMDNTKVGVSFRIGRNVRVEMMLELGPQNATTPFPPGSAKREVIPQGFPKKQTLTSNSTVSEAFPPRNDTISQGWKTLAGPKIKKLKSAKKQKKLRRKSTMKIPTTTRPPTTTLEDRNATELDMRENEIDQSDNK